LWQFREVVGDRQGRIFINIALANGSWVAAFDRLGFVNRLGGTAYEPFKSNSLPGEPRSRERMYGFSSLKRDEFMKRYHMRSNIETTILIIKAKFRDLVRSKTDTATVNEVLRKLLNHNIVVVHHSIIELAIERTFGKGKPKEESPYSSFPELHSVS
jgi:hypothetical protein